MMTTNEANTRTRIRLVLAPITIILICLPLLFDLIPRNGWYGIRVREAYASDAAWYAINRAGGVWLIVTCLIWIVVAVYAPAKYVTAIGTGLILLTVALMTIVEGWTL
jgi:hypothetical protein